MQNRPIHTLAEDFQYLGLPVDETDHLDEMDAPPAPDKKQAAMQKKMNVAKTKMAALQKKALKAGVPAEDVELAMLSVTEDELDELPEDMETLDEFKIVKFFKNLLKKGKKKPSRAERLKKAKKAKQYRKGRGRSQAKRYRKSSRFKKLKKLYAKAKKMGKKAVKGARRSFASMLGSSTEYPGGQELSELGSIINALEHTEDSSQYAAGYANIAKAATATAGGLRELDESYVDIHFPLDEAADYCELIAAEAREFLGALEERDGTISVEDQRLLDEHLAELHAEALAMANYADDTNILVALDEGRMPFEQEVVESEGLFGAELDEDEDLFFEDEDEDEEDPFEGIRGEVALMFGIRHR